MGQDPTLGGRLRGTVPRSKGQQAMPSGSGRRSVLHQLASAEEPSRQKGQPPPDDYAARLKRSKAVPEKQIQIGGATGRAGSRTHLRPSPTLQTQRAGAASSAHRRADDSRIHDNSYRGSEASTVHRPGGHPGDYSFRSNVDLFNPDKQCPPSRVLPDQSQSFVGSVDSDSARK